MVLHQGVRRSDKRMHSKTLHTGPVALHVGQGHSSNLLEPKCLQDMYRANILSGPKAVSWVTAMTSLYHILLR